MGAAISADVEPWGGPARLPSTNNRINDMEEKERTERLAVNKRQGQALLRLHAALRAKYDAQDKYSEAYADLWLSSSIDGAVILGISWDGWAGEMTVSTRAGEAVYEPDNHTARVFNRVRGFDGLPADVLEALGNLEKGIMTPDVAKELLGSVRSRHYYRGREKGYAEDWDELEWERVRLEGGGERVKWEDVAPGCIFPDE